MINKKVSEIFFEIADLLEMKNVDWKPAAYRKAARVIERLEKPLEEIYKKEGLKGLDNIEGVGEGISKKIEEYIKTKNIKEYENLKKSTPKEVNQLMNIPGIGPKKAKILTEKLKIKSIKDLIKAAKEHKISKLPEFKEKSEENILKSISFIREKKKRLPYNVVMPIAMQIKDSLKKGVKNIEICGSLRRKKDTIKDIDILIASTKPELVINKFVNLKEVKKVLGKGTTRASVILNNKIRVDIRVVNPDEWGSALQYLTGSKDHSINLRKLAIEKGLKLSEYGVFRGNKRIASKTEQAVYNALGLRLIPPEERIGKDELKKYKINSH